MGSNQRQSVTKIVSGGQTGVDRGALDAAIELRIAHGGWCPHGRLAEDGCIPADYRLQETRSSDYRVRTEQNVIDSDGTLILFRRRMHGGTDLTRRLAQRHHKPTLAVDLDIASHDGNSGDLATVRDWVADNGVTILNVAGPRESSSPGIAAAAREFIRELLAGSDERGQRSN